MGEDNIFYSCKQPLKKDEVRTLHVDKPGDECDHTNYGHKSGPNQPDFNVLDLYKQAHPNVVKIDVTYSGGKDHKQHFSSGTGFVVDGPDGHKRIVTADHVVHEPSYGKAVDITIGTAKRDGLFGKIERFDPKTDIAVLKVDPKLEKLLPAALPLGTTDAHAAAVAVGHARGAEDDFVSPGQNNGTITENKLKQLTGSGIEGSRINPNMPLIDTRAHVEPGQSGGPLLNAKGEVQGVVIASDLRSHAYSVPVSKVLPMLQIHNSATSHVEKPGKPLELHPQLGIDLRATVPVPPHKPEFKAGIPLPPTKRRDPHDS